MGQMIALRRVQCEPQQLRPGRVRRSRWAAGPATIAGTGALATAAPRRPFLI